MEQKIERVQKNSGLSYKLNYSLEAVEVVSLHTPADTQYIMHFFPLQRSMCCVVALVINVKKDQLEKTYGST